MWLECSQKGMDTPTCSTAQVLRLCILDRKCVHWGEHYMHVASADDTSILIVGLNENCPLLLIDVYVIVIIVTSIITSVFHQTEHVPVH